MGKPRLKVVLRCTHCRARVRLDGPAAEALADDPAQPVPCPRCEREFTTAPAGPEPVAAAAPEPAPKPPPFGDLVRDAEPAVPFGRLEAMEAADQPARKPTLSERWSAIPPGRQRLVLGAALAAMAVAVAAWPGAGSPPAHGAVPADVLPPVDTSRRDPPPQPEPLYQVLTTARVGLNTRVTPENVDALFRRQEVTDPPAKAVRSRDALLGKYVIQELPAGAIVYEWAVADKPKEEPRPAPPPPPPPPPTSPPQPERVIAVVGQFTVTETTYVEVSPGRWVKKPGSERTYPIAQANPTPPAPGANAYRGLFFNPFDLPSSPAPTPQKP